MNIKFIRKLLFLIEFHQNSELRLETPYYVTPKITNVRIYCDGHGNYHRYTKKELVINQLKYLKNIFCYIMRNIFHRKKHIYEK